MQTLSEIRRLLDERGLRPRKALGQNFLVDPAHVRRLAEDAAVGPGDTVLEVGPGTGTLTAELVERGCRVVACELDRDLAALLRDTIVARSPDRVTLIEGDCLTGKRVINPDILRAVDGAPFRLVANLPYQAATPLLLAMMTQHPACLSVHVTVQREVAERMTAAPGTTAYGSLSVVCNAMAHSRRLAVLPPGCFWPPPSVTSAMIALRRRPDPLANRPGEPARLADFAQTLFTARRKQLATAMRRLFGFDGPWPADIDRTSRAETISADGIIALLRAVEAGAGPATARSPAGPAVSGRDASSSDADRGHRP